MLIHVTPLGRGRYAARLNGRLLCESRTPLLSAARALLREGVAEDTILTMSHEGTSVVSLRAPIGVAAALAVVESEREGPRFTRHRPMPSDIAFPAVTGSPKTAADSPEQGKAAQTETAEIDGPRSEEEPMAA